MSPLPSLCPSVCPVQQERIIDIWARTITNSRPEKEQINIFDRIFKLTIINVDMFKSRSIYRLCADMEVFYIFENNKQPNKSQIMHEANEKGFSQSRITRSLFSFSVLASAGAREFRGRLSVFHDSGKHLRWRKSERNSRSLVAFARRSAQITTFSFAMIIHLHMLFMPFICWTTSCELCVKISWEGAEKKSDYTNRFQIAFVGFFAAAELYRKTETYSIRLLVAINNRLPKSFITNLLTKFIFNFIPRLLLLLVIPSLHPLQIYWLPKTFVASFIFKLQVLFFFIDSRPFIRN